MPTMKLFKPGDKVVRTFNVEMFKCIMQVEPLKYPKDSIFTVRSVYADSISLWEDYPERKWASRNFRLANDNDGGFDELALIDSLLKDYKNGKV